MQETSAKVKNFKDRLEKSLLNPTDNVYVPGTLINSIVEVCELIDTDTYLYNKDGSINLALSYPYALFVFIPTFPQMLFTVNSLLSQQK